MITWSHARVTQLSLCNWMGTNVEQLNQPSNDVIESIINSNESINSPLKISAELWDRTSPRKFLLPEKQSIQLGFKQQFQSRCAAGSTHLDCRGHEDRKTRQFHCTWSSVSRSGSHDNRWLLGSHPSSSNPPRGHQGPRNPALKFKVSLINKF